MDVKILARSLLAAALALLLLPALARARSSFAILPFEAAAGIGAEEKEAFVSSLYQHLFDSARYELVDRARIEQIFKEQALGQSGAVDPEKAAQVGKIAGVERLITGRIYKKPGKGDIVAASLSVLRVATAEIEFVTEISSNTAQTATESGRYASAEIINRYPLLGGVLAQSGQVYAVDLGSRHGLRTGQRLFVARKEVMLGDGGEVLFESIERVGTARVEKVSETRSLVKPHAMEMQGGLKKDDLVSPDPVPKRELAISNSPLLAAVTAGKPILDDDMSAVRYLSPSRNKGEPYRGGKLHLDASELETGYTYCFYPAPYNRLENFIVEGDVEFLQGRTDENQFFLDFRSNGDYSHAETYSLMFNNKGKFKIDMFLEGRSFNLIPAQSSPHLKRADGKDKFKIVAHGPQFDLYLNDKFVVGFTHEKLYEGTIGLEADYGSYVTLDNVKIWEAVRQ